MMAVRLLRPPILIAVGLAIAMVYPLLMPVQYFQHLAILTLLYASNAVAWNIMGGYTGYISLGHSAFFGLGAYLVALVSIHWGWNPFLAAPLMGLAVALFGLGVGIIALRTRGHAFVIATIALVYILQVVALNWRDLTRGISGLQLPLPPYPVESIKIPFYYAVLILLCFSIWVSWRIKNSKFGLGLIAIREDEDKAASVGVSTTLYKILALCISVYLVGTAGGIYAYYQTAIDPVLNFNILFGIQMILMTILGGKGTLWGPVLGAFIMQPLSELVLFRFGSSQIHIAIFGILVLLLVIYLPRGIIPSVGDYWLSYRRRRYEATASSAEGGTRPS